MAPQNRTLFEGETAELNCRFLSGDPAHIQWVKHYAVNGSYVASNGTFYFTIVRVIDESTFRLQVKLLFL